MKIRYARTQEEVGDILLLSVEDGASQPELLYNAVRVLAQTKGEVIEIVEENQ